MRLFLLLALAAIPAFGSHVTGREFVKENSIVGGKDTEIQEVPHMVVILYNNSVYCGGSIIDEYNILTAAHCLSRIPPLSMMSVRSASSYFDEGGRIHRIQNTTIHKKYISWQTDYDVGLIRLTEPIQFDEKAKPIKLPKTGPETGETVRVSGWGTISDGGPISKHLKSVEVQVVDWKDCKKRYEELTPRMICAAGPEKDSCFGDSGGGMDHKGEVVGIVSFGQSCADPMYPGVYTNVADPEILEFIRGNLN